jgi:hypothetical protein
VPGGVRRITSATTKVHASSTARTGQGSASSAVARLAPTASLVSILPPQVVSGGKMCAIHRAVKRRLRDL